ncbi:MAG: TauD/TfdA family dioxygenase [Rhodospirillaceae bacterium]|nr:TauD/TfdA family dioxygenase [Rhodospirillaceae bacterium]
MEAKLNIRPLHPTLGAEVAGVDLASPLAPETYRALHQAWMEHLVLVFPGQGLSDEQQIAFARQFGELEVHHQDIIKSRASPEIFRLSNVDDDGKLMPAKHPYVAQISLAQRWHTDSSFRPVPSMGSILHGVEITEDGGETWFANMYAAYEHVPQELKTLLADKTALHVYDYEMRERFDIDAGLDGIAHYSHPVIIRHPDTGRPALYVNPLMTARINELPADESRAVLDELFAIGQHPSVVYEHVWARDDFIMWDNLCSMHARTDFSNDERRLLRRCVIEGERPVAA